MYRPWKHFSVSSNVYFNIEYVRKLHILTTASALFFLRLYLKTTDGNISKASLHIHCTLLAILFLVIGFLPRPWIGQEHFSLVCSQISLFRNNYFYILHRLLKDFQIFTKLFNSFSHMSCRWALHLKWVMPPILYIFFFYQSLLTYTAPVVNADMNYMSKRTPLTFTRKPLRSMCKFKNYRLFLFSFSFC